MQSLHHRLAAAAIALAAAAAPALAADVPGDRGTTAVLPLGRDAGVRFTFERPGDSDWYRVDLGKGENYAVVVSSTPGDGFSTRVTLRDRAGRVIKSIDAEADISEGLEYAPPVSGTYFVEARNTGAQAGVAPPYAGQVTLTTDCLASRATACSIAVGQTRRRLFSWENDYDWYKAVLRGGRRYTVTARGVDRSATPPLAVRDPSGNVVGSNYVGGTLSFKAGVGGTYYLSAYAGDFDLIYSYDIELTSP